MSWARRVKGYADDHPVPDYDPKEIARSFCEMTDEQQAEFFIECDKLGRKWESDYLQQWYAIGRHLRICECSNKKVRKMIKALFQGTV